MAFKYFIPALLWASIILLAISLPGNYFPQTGLSKIPHFDKLVHFGLFTVFGILLSYGFYNQRPQTRIYLLIPMMIGLFYGIITEVLQSLVFTMRQGSILDLLANIFGTIFGILLFWILLKFLIRKKIVKP